MPRLRVPSLVRAHVGGSRWMFLSHINVSSSSLTSLPPICLKSIKRSSGEGFVFFWCRNYGSYRSFCPVSIQPCTMKNRDIYWRRNQIQETLYIGQLSRSPFQNRHLGTSHSFPSISSTIQNTPQNPLLGLPPANPSYFPESHWQSEISSLSKVILVLEKAINLRVPNLGCRRTESPGWFDVLPKNSAQDTIHEWARYHDEAVNHQLPKAAAFWIIWIVSTQECSSLAQNLMLFVALLTHFECDGHRAHMLTQQICRPLWLVQCSCHCSHMCILVHSPWLPDYTDVVA